MSTSRLHRWWKALPQWLRITLSTLGVTLCMVAGMALSLSWQSHERQQWSERQTLTVTSSNGATDQVEGWVSLDGEVRVARSAQQPGPGEDQLRGILFGVVIGAFLLAVPVMLVFVISGIILAILAPFEWAKLFIRRRQQALALESRIATTYKED